MQSSELAVLMERIAEKYPFTSDRYPALKRLSENGRKSFVVSHSVHHMNKSIGKLSGECESFDHGGVMNERVLREAAVKMVINALKLAQELGITADDLLEEVPLLMKSA